MSKKAKSAKPKHAAPKAAPKAAKHDDHKLGLETGLHHEDGQPTGKPYVDPNAPKAEPEPGIR